MRTLDETRGAVRVEDLYDTDIDDLWEACTTPERLARWIAGVYGDLRVGGTIQAVFTSTWTGPGRVEVCDAPHHLLLTTEPGTDDEGQIEAWLTEEGSETRLVVEERGLPMASSPFHGSGWQVHLEDLGRSLAEATARSIRRAGEPMPAPAGGSAGTSSPLPTSDGDRLMSDVIRLSVTTVNAPDAIALATVLRRDHRRRREGDEHWAIVYGPNGDIGFQQVDDYRPPVWPDGDVAMQMHLDFFVDDLEATGARALAAGATRSSFQPNADHCFVYADPAGHPFCLSTWDGPHLDDEPDE